MSSLIMGGAVITRPAPASPGKAGRQKPDRYERCLDSSMNDVLNQDTSRRT
jgi:hypothetical protein